MQLSEDDIKTIKASDGMSYTAILPHTGAVEDLLMSHRRVAYQHVWDVKLHNKFLDDFYALPNDAREAALLAVAVLTHTKYPSQAGQSVNMSSLLSYGIGCGYHIVYTFRAEHHCIVLYFIRREEGTDSELELNIPHTQEPDDWRVAESAELGILESYGYKHRSDA